MCEAKVLALKTNHVQITFLISRANGNTSINRPSRVFDGRRGEKDLQAQSRVTLSITDFYVVSITTHTNAPTASAAGTACSSRPDLLPLKVSVCGSLLGLVGCWHLLKVWFNANRPADLVELPGATSHGCKCPSPASESIKKQASSGLKVNKHVRAAHLPVLKPEITSRETL